MSLELYSNSSYKISELITKEYSTSFSLATSLLEKEKKRAIYSIYGFVRLADEIVDTFHSYDKKLLLDEFIDDFEYAYKAKISTNPVIYSFIDTVEKYNIEKFHIDSFLKSMKNDLVKSEYTEADDLENYIYGSANVVGLMCLKVFCDKNERLYEKLKSSAEVLGSAFQKVNFLRDLKDDMGDLGRSYFPEISDSKFDNETKIIIEDSIEKEFDEALVGLKQLPGRSKLAVALAYFYYRTLFNNIRAENSERVMHFRIRIPDWKKYLIIVKVFVLYKMKFI